MTRRSLNNSYGDVMMLIQSWEGHIGVTSSSPSNVPAPDQQIDTVVITNLTKLDSQQMRQIQSNGLVIDSIDLEGFKLVLVPSTTGATD